MQDLRVAEVYGAEGGIGVGIWVRSQDHTTLVHCNALGINNAHQIWGDSVGGKETYVLSQHLTKAEALQVLDMIDEHRRKDNKHQGELGAFQMPAAGFGEEGGETQWT